MLLHYEAFQQEGARVSYKEFDFGHLDFTFAVWRLQQAQLQPHCQYLRWDLQIPVQRQGEIATKKCRVSLPPSHLELEGESPEEAFRLDLILINVPQWLCRSRMSCGTTCCPGCCCASKAAVSFCLFDPEAGFALAAVSALCTGMDRQNEPQQGLCSQISLVQTEAQVGR